MSASVPEDLKRRLDAVENELATTTKQMKLLSSEIETAKKERQEMLNVVYSLRSQMQYWNSWLCRSVTKNSNHDNVAVNDGVELSPNCSGSQGNASDAEKDKNEGERERIISDQSSLLNDEENVKKVTNTSDKETDKGKDTSVADLLKATAENAFANTGMSYDPNSGLYYDWNTHMYYDPSSHLFYDNDNGIYYYYDTEKNSYVFHSQIKIPVQVQVTNSPRSNGEKSEGELSDSDEEFNSRKAPCIRAIVTVSNSIKPGSLYLVTCNGVILGRDKEMGICIPDLEASKYHAEIKYEEDGCQYYVRDQGSNNGTFLNDKRLADTKIQSEWFKIKHKDYLKIGETSLLLHVHYNQETCDDCEPGQVQALLAASSAKDEKSTDESFNREQVRKKQLQQLKKKYMVGGDGLKEAMAPINSGKYKDRADRRRQTIGSTTNIDDKPKEPMRASVTKSISNENKGHKLMEKMGWKPGEGLGKQKSGISEPINVVIREHKKGLGSGVTKSIDDPNGKSVSFKWKKARQRYNDIVKDELLGKKETQEDLPIDEF